MPRGRGAKRGRKRGNTGLRQHQTDSDDQQEDVWAQCDNPACKKWRRLPPGTVIDSDAPWFCELNPDPHYNTCTKPEESYTDDGSKALDLAGVSQGAVARNGEPGKPQKQRRGKRGPHGMEASIKLEVGDGKHGVHKRRRAHTASDESNGQGWAAPPPARHFSSIDEENDAIRRACEQILAQAGTWHSSHSSAVGTADLFHFPDWVWNGLSAYAGDAAGIASQAVDLYSAALLQPEAASSAPRSEIEVFTRLAVMTAACRAQHHLAQIVPDRQAPASQPQPTGILKPPSASPGDLSAQQSRVKFAEQLAVVFPASAEQPQPAGMPNTSPRGGRPPGSGRGRGRGGRPPGGRRGRQAADQPLRPKPIPQETGPPPAPQPAVPHQKHQHQPLRNGSNASGPPPSPALLARPAGGSLGRGGPQFKDLEMQSLHLEAGEAISAHPAFLHSAGGALQLHERSREPPKPGDWPPQAGPGTGPGAEAGPGSSSSGRPSLQAGGITVIGEHWIGDTASVGGALGSSSPRGPALQGWSTKLGGSQRPGSAPGGGEGSRAAAQLYREPWPTRAGMEDRDGPGLPNFHQAAGPSSQ